MQQLIIHNSNGLSYFTMTAYSNKINFSNVTILYNVGETCSLFVIQPFYILIKLLCYTTYCIIKSIVLYNIFIYYTTCYIIQLICILYNLLLYKTYLYIIQPNALYNVFVYHTA